MEMDSISSRTSYVLLLLLASPLMMMGVCSGFGTFGFDIHHRFSDPVKEILGLDDQNLPTKGSAHYYAVMAHRDKAIHGRKLATTDSPTPLTFFYGNDTFQIASLGFLYYANISVGNPSLSFLVALDTGSNLFWLPCDCSSTCVRSLQSSSGSKLELSIYSPNASSTSGAVTCNSSLCSQRERARCSSAQNNCPYRVDYLSNDTSTSGYYVQDELHLISDDTQSKPVDARITFGCGQVQTGSFLDGAAPNGLLGLGMDNVSVPSTLAREGYTYNSFSMCFGENIVGRISFGDRGSSDQGETPFNLDGRPSRTLYNITISEISVGGNDTGYEFTAIFDSGTSFTYLNDPPYSLITDSFNSMVNEKRHTSTSTSTSGIPFEYCYDISKNQEKLMIPTLILLMKGGDYFNVTNPIELIQLESGAYVYCLALVKSGDVNIIGQNFMTDYRVLFDLERKVLAWKLSDCNGNSDFNTLPISPTGSSAPPATAVNPQATGNGNNSSSTLGPGVAPSSGSHARHLIPFTCTLIMLLVSFFATV